MLTVMTSANGSSKGRTLKMRDDGQACVFLDPADNKSCRIYDVRPTQCRLRTRYRQVRPVPRCLRRSTTRR